MLNSEQKIFTITDNRPSESLYSFNKGFATLGLIFVVIFPLFYIYVLVKSKPDINHIYFLIPNIIILQQIIRTYINVVHEIKVDYNYLYVRKFVKFKKVSWDDIKCIKVANFRTWGISKFKITKKKNSKKLQFRVFLISGVPSELRIIELKEKLLLEIEKRTKVIHSKLW